MKSQFPLKLITLGVLTAFSTTAVAAQDSPASTRSASDSSTNGYTQGAGEFATVPQYTKVERVDTAQIPTNSASKVTGELNRLGNPVRIIWYGRKGDADGEIAQKGAINNGQVFGKVSATGKDNVDGKDGFNASVQVEGQGNAIDALGWSSYKNKRGVTYTLDKIDNNGTAHGEAHLQGALADVNGDVTGFVVGNGISIVGTADFGKVTRVSGGSISGGGGATRTSRSSASSSVKVSPSGSGLTLDDLKNPNDKMDNTLPTEADWKGKDINIALNALTNTGSLKGTLIAQGYDNLNGKSASHTKDTFSPQFASSTGWSSGNGVSVATLTDTPDRINISDERMNTAKLGTVNNSGSITGDAIIKGGTNTSHTATYNRSSGNGISVYAGTGRNAKATTESHIGDITNSGQIIGKLTQQSGQNSGFTANIQSATAESYAGGNGISAMTDTDNAQVKSAKTTIGTISNTGTISGEAVVKSGTHSTGDLTLKSYNVGNGISAYLKSSAASYELSIGNIDNSGIITGQVETEAGVATFNGDNNKGAGYYTPPKEAVKLLVYQKGDPIGSTFAVTVTPKAPKDAPKNDPWRPSLESYTANSDVFGSGNGIALARHQNDKSNAKLGNITNKGVISGQATMYHGYTKSGGYADVAFGNVGAGIAIDSTLESKVDNLGLISGNHAALLVKGTLDTQYSSTTPDIIGGYTKNKVTNYGLMAGTLIAGNYEGYSGGTKLQKYHYFDTADSSFTNHGTYVYLQEGVTRIDKWSTTAKRHNNAEDIKEVKVASEQSTKQTVDGKEYTIINGTVANSKKDSSYTPTTDSINNTIINGAGVEKGALIADKDLTLTDSIINGYKTGLYIADNKTVTATGTIISANPFKVNNQPTQSVLGTNGENNLTVSGGFINGDTNLLGGNDTLTIKDATAQLNGKIDMGEGEDTVKFGTVANDASEDAPITFFRKIANTEKLEVNTPTKLMPTSSIQGVNTLTLNSTLYYPVDTINGKQTHALNNSITGDFKLSGNGKFLVETDKATTEIDFGTARVQSTDTSTIQVNNVTQKTSIQGGKIVIETKKPMPSTGGSTDTGQNTGGGSAGAGAGSQGGSASSGGTGGSADSTGAGGSAGAGSSSSTGGSASSGSQGGGAGAGSQGGSTDTGSSQNVGGGAGSQGGGSGTGASTGSQGGGAGSSSSTGGSASSGETGGSQSSGGSTGTGGGAGSQGGGSGTGASTGSQGGGAGAGSQGGSASTGGTGGSADSTGAGGSTDTGQNTGGANTGGSTDTGSSQNVGGGAGNPSGGAGASTGTGTGSSSSGSNTNVNTKDDSTIAQSDKTEFKTPYVDAYNSYISSWKNGNANFLKKSGSIDTKDESIAQQAVNTYLVKTVEQNIYAALPNATLDSTKQYGQTILNDGWLLPVGSTDINTQVQAQSRSYNQPVNKIGSTQAIFKAAYGLFDQLTVGAALGYGNNQIEGKDGSQLSGKGLYAGSYAVTNIANINVIAGASYYHADLSGNRSITNGFDSHQFDANANTVTTTIYAQGKYEIPLGYEMALSPKIGIMAHRFSFSGSQEQGVAALTINQNTQNIIDAAVGVELAAKKVLPIGTLSAKLSADYVNTSGGQPMTASFQNGSSFALKGTMPSQTVRVGGKVGYQLNDKATINAHLANDIHPQGNALKGGVSINYQF